ncbi:uncharacterized protein LOC117175112 isoform X1 [Belonocnema kinseyi]|uniref:uncharacterized protein LOC117175112 isoform X1 n=1 Tax=Belonocnema kinseyi TaxID=2817044 RepID=UPI00143DD578|nr:uncharacterized protein LOC117175112 isoform X1 [Belonocnema kinseyi]
MWTLHSMVLDFIPFAGKHLGRDIVELVMKCLEDYGLCGKVQSITVDNTAANTTLMSQLSHLLQSVHGENFDSIDQYFRCFAHILNLGVQALLEVIGEGAKAADLNDGRNDNDTEDTSDAEDEEVAREQLVINRLRAFFKKIRASEQLTEKF